MSVCRRSVVNMPKSLWLFLVVAALAIIPCLECQSTTTRNRIRQAVVVRRVRPATSSADITSTTESLDLNDSVQDQETVLEQQHENNGQTL